MIKRLIKKLPFVLSIHRYLKWKKSEGLFSERYPRGHFYSPLPDIDQVRINYDKITNSDTESLAGIDLKADSQWDLIEKLDGFLHEYDLPETIAENYRYYSDNPMFGKGSAMVLYSMIQHFQPKRIIEVGSGFTSAIILDVNERLMNGEIKSTFIEPYPDRLYSILKDKDRKTAEIITEPLQNVSIDLFRELEENDLLFIDSSHVSKIGSDINRIFFEILPLLKPGVIVHFHDIYWPFEYPMEWFELGRAWNEAYLLRAFLQYNEIFQIILFNNFISHNIEKLPSTHPLKQAGLGSSIWLRKK